MILDVSEAEFADKVVARSAEVPVVVDFWASWCGPCRQLTPALEKAASSREGKVDLAKVDVDANKQLAGQFGVQGIPAVKAFRDGTIADEFVGALPPAQVEKFFDGLVPSEAEQLSAAGDEQSLRKAVELEPGRADAAVPLARILHERGDTDDAVRVLEPVTGSFAADGLLARIELEGQGRHADAFAALDAGDTERGLDLLLDDFADPDTDTDQLRRVVVGVLDEQGADSELARTYRRRLATALY
ncbi:MAG: tetratricopeptide repeat protein [Solirubrobacterales bacterium]